jgi:hypothetical protein
MDMQVSFGVLCLWAKLTMQQDDSYHEAIERCVMLFLRIYLANRHVKMSIFIHKSEVLSEDYRGGMLSSPYRPIGQLS